MQPQLQPWIGALWAAFIVIWILGAIRTKPTRRTQSGASRLLQAGLAILGAFFCSTPS